MKKFSRCVLIIILAAVISGVAGFIYFNQSTKEMYSSTTKLYVVPGADNEASIRAKDGGLNDDFKIIFKSNVVISAAQKKAGTSEDIAQYLTINSPENSNIIEITCTNPDQNTAKKYADAVASTAIKTTSIIPVESIQILSEGTSSGVAKKPGVYKNTLKVAGVVSGIALFIEILIILIIGAFKNKEEEYDDELEYERKYGKYARVNYYSGLADREETVKEEIEKAGAEKEDIIEEDILQKNDIDDGGYEKPVFEEIEEEMVTIEPETEETEEAEELEETEELEEAVEIKDQEAAATKETNSAKKSKSSSKIFGRIHK